MSLSRYQRYKDSGVRWIGQVPAHWEVDRLKRKVRLITDKSEKRTRAVALENIEGWTGRFLETETEFQGEGVSFCEGDVLFGKLRPYLAKVYVTEFDGEAVGDFHVMRPAQSLANRFALYQMLTGEFISVVDGSTFGAKMPRADWESVGAMPLAIPPMSEQLEIVRFLDRETAKIDTLIDGQKRLIELLKEKRQAVISHAVTKGLDANAPLKDSGVEWLGEVPAHWIVTPLMHLTPTDRSIMYGIVLPGPNVEEGVPIVKGGDVKPNRLRLASLNRTTVEIEKAYERARLNPNDIVYSIRGSIGDAELVPSELKEANITQDVARVSPRDGINSRWLLYAMKSDPIFVQLEQRSLGAAVRGINIFDLKRVRVPCPPRAEQDQIAAFLDAKLAALDALESEAQTATQLLREHRSALIAAAVTGKIDVREVIGNEVEAA
ncbi:MAG TPA: restriction endonuclease subunit S [Xanthobacteraceae bacterium]|nr:restriction endonuclease subunit S [Xanthobacteraceae bacterium]